MAQADSAVIKVRVEPDLTDFTEAVASAIPGRPASELRLEALRLAVGTHCDAGTPYVDRIVATAKSYADFVIEGVA